MAVIRERQVVADSWQLLKPAADGSLAVPATGDVIVPLGVWREQSAALRTRAGKVGVWLDSHEDPALIADDLQHLELIAVNFPQFTDGRGYSIARLLRERYGWRGELRAIGDVLRDQLSYLASCGFDALDLRAGQDAQAALASLDDFSEAYQSSAARPQPLFRRREVVAPDGMELASR